MPTSPAQDPFSSINLNFKSAFDSARAMILRAFTHVVLILVSLALHIALPDDFSFTSALAAYISLIHIFPRKPHPIGTAAGLALGATFGFMGMPLAALPVWSACATWFIRMISRGTVSPISWISLPILGAMAVNLADNPALGGFPPLWPFAIFIAAGVGLNTLLKRYMNTRRRRLEVQTAVIALRKLAFNADNARHTQALSQLCDEVDRYMRNHPSNLFKKPDKDDEALLDQLIALPVAAMEQSAWNRPTDIDQMARKFKKRNERYAPIKPVETPRPKGPAGHLRAVRQLEELLPTLPSDIKPQIGLICEQAALIVEAMEKEPRYRPAAERFLSRYLPAIDKVISGYIKVSANPPSEHSARVLNRASNTLNVLAEAFKNRRTELFMNDATDIDIDLGVIENLLKMEGHTISR